MRAADALIFPARWEEPLTRTLLEAGSMGLPGRRPGGRRQPRHHSRRRDRPARRRAGGLGPALAEPARRSRPAAPGWPTPRARISRRTSPRRSSCRAWRRSIANSSPAATCASALMTREAPLHIVVASRAVAPQHGFGGLERAVAHHLRALARRGVRLSVFTQPPDPGQPPPDTFDGHGHLAHVPYRRRHCRCAATRSPTASSITRRSLARSARRSSHAAARSASTSSTPTASRGWVTLSG